MTTALAVIPQEEQIAKQQELAEIRQSFVQIADKESHDFAVSSILKADNFVKNVKNWFSKFENPLKEALDNLREEKKKLIEPAELFIKEQRKLCLEWQETEERRLEKEKKEAIDNLMPWEDMEAVLEPVSTSSGGASLRKLPWDVRVESEDALWEAAVKDPKYRAFFAVDLKALKAKAQSQKEAFNIPGCVAFQGKTLQIKKG